MPRTEDKPEYTLYRSRPRFLRGDDREGGALDAIRARRRQTHEDGPGPRRRFLGKRLTVKSVIVYLLLFGVLWTALSFVLFMISAEIEHKEVSPGTEAALASGPSMLTSANTILILGSDARSKGTHEKGANVGGPSRSDAIMLMRVGGGASAKLSIPRDTVVNIPGHGRNKINAAYAFGGPALAIKTVSQFMGLPINHVVEVNFDNFPALIDSMGGVDYKGGCVVSKINGGFRNGGYTLRLRAGEHHLNGKQALALARTRHNDCHRNESDLTRQVRQQQILAAMKDRVLSPMTFVRMPWVAWNAPKATKTDMGGLTMLTLAAAIAAGDSAQAEVLKPSGGVRLADGGDALVVSQAEVDRARQQFLGE